MPSEYRLYGNLAAWWPLISPPADYAAEAGYFAAVLRSAPNPVHETHRLGLFSRYSWLRLLAETGFEASSLIEMTAGQAAPGQAAPGGEPAPREIFIGHRRP